MLNEFFVTVTEKLDPGLDRERAWRSVRSLFAWKPIPVDVRVLEIAWSLVERYELSWWDSLIVAAAQLTDSAYLLSEDLQEGQRFGDLEVINPFAGRPDP